MLVPSPNVTADHQTLNARWFEQQGGARVVRDADFDVARLHAIADELLAPGNQAELLELERGIAALARPWAAARIATIVAECGAARVRKQGSFVTDEQPLAGRTIHFLGAGGAGVSALAQLCVAWGADVSGCDRAESDYTELVRNAGVHVEIGHDPAHIVAGMDVVASSALPADHPELVRARELGCRVLLRGELLGELTRLRETVVIAGAHGKSTTTGMLAHAAPLCGLDPSAALGATLASLRDERGAGGNVRVGSGAFLVEGDESDRTLLRLAARIAVVTNIERDHHHTFVSDEEVEELFAQWVRSLGADSLLIAGPGEPLDRLVPHAPGRVVRFGDDETELAELASRLAVPGRHNALNASAALAVLRELGVERDAGIDALATFPGVGRRFEVHGDAGGVMIVDDYAHHPTEVAATIAAARERAEPRGGRVVVVFQPHLYSRTKALWLEFATALAGSDRAWILPIYGAREEPIVDVDELLIANALVEQAPAVYAGLGLADPATGDLATIIDELQTGDVLITMGAGSITALAPRLLAALQASGTRVRARSTGDGGHDG